MNDLSRILKTASKKLDQFPLEKQQEILALVDELNEIQEKEQEVVKEIFRPKVPFVTLSMLAMQFYIILNTNWKIVESDARETTVKEIGNLLLGKYLLPFEVISVLLLASLIGAAMLSRRKTEK